ncbi:TetR/AcrR family transcriptional regulator [Primorskyibacter marinus]|uniref:TetR/AcrR family transcriptional regulator n=1 Tax=Primorskyibacter marinus TaxID=1977320 RepID=UPI000E307DC8|nr:TetR/AcrR family transcriptional regulator [Primorskyibacter marinus]
MIPRQASRDHRSRTQETMRRIKSAAHEQFVKNGLEGTRIETIATRAGVNKALIYRHFGDRENLYRAVLEEAYHKVRAAEAKLKLAEDPCEALEQLVAFTFEYYVRNPDFLALVGVENLNHGRHLAQIDTEVLKISSLRRILGDIISRGIERDLFREDLREDSLYLMISGLCWFTVATAHTFSITFEIDILERKELDRRKAEIVEAVFRFVKK